MALNTFRVSKFSSAFAPGVTHTYGDVDDDTISPDKSSVLRVAVSELDNNDIRLVALGSTNVAVSTQIRAVKMRIYQASLSADNLTMSPMCCVVSAFEAGQPFWMSQTSRFYLPIGLVGISGMSGSDITPLGDINRVADSLVLADITTQQGYVQGHTNGMGSVYPAFRPSAVLGDYSISATNIDYVLTSTGVPISIGSRVTTVRHGIYGDYVNIGYMKTGQLRARVFEIAALRILDPKDISFSSDVFSGSMVGVYDGFNPSGAGFLQVPSLTVSTASSGTGFVAGTRSYIVVWSAKDRAGNVHYSRTSAPVTYTNGSTGKALVQFSIPTIHQFRNCEIQASIFRTQPGGTVYNLVDNVVLSSPFGLGLSLSFVFNFTDGTVDATVAANPQYFRQPGTVGTPLDRYPALAGSHIVRHKDRVFYCRDSVVYYSGAAVDGEAPWFNPAFSIQVPGGSGPIVGLASMDGTLVVFKKNAVFLIDGDGPPDNGGTGTEFSTPRRIHAEHGCVDPRTIVPTPAGIMYRSNRGIELLDRGFQVRWIGEKVQRTVDANPISGGATFDRSDSRAYFPMATAFDATYGSIFDRATATSSGVVCCYDLPNDAWSVLKYYELDSGDGVTVKNSSVQDAAFVYGSTLASVPIDTIYMGGGFNSNYLLRYEDPTIGTDDSTGKIATWLLQTGWIRSGSIQDRNLINELNVLGFWNSGFNLRCQYYWNYDKSSLLPINLFDATATNKSPVQMSFQPPRSEAESMSFILSSESPTNPTTVGSGRQVDLHGVTVKIGNKAGGFKLPSAQRG
jgi:hypothetical protein